MIIEAAGPYAAAIKPNLAFYEAHGSAGLAALERIRACIPADIPVVMDAKRGDIGTTAAQHALALFDGLGADAVTVNPYPGSEALAPLFARGDRFAYILCRTSNPGAAEIQGLVVAADPDGGAPAEPLYLRIARRVVNVGSGGHGRPRRRGDRAGRAARDPGRRARAGRPGSGGRSTGRRDRTGPARRSGDLRAGSGGDRPRAARQRVARDQLGRPGGGRRRSAGRRR